jgi:hypothetical protein
MILAVLALSVAVVAQTELMPKWKSKTVQFSTDVLVSGVLLKPGDYNVTHVMEGSKHILVFKDNLKRKEMVRAECTMKLLEKSAEADRIAYVVNAQGVRELKELNFRGDKILHML